MMNLYFAYGSNMDKQRFLDRVGNFRSERAAILRDHELCFNKLASGSVDDEGYANIMPSHGSVVEGILYEIDDNGIAILDGWEACPAHYERIEMEVEIPLTDEIQLAQVYIANPRMRRKGLYPTEEYLRYLLSGKRLLTPGYIKFLASFPTLESMRKIGA